MKRVKIFLSFIFIIVLFTPGYSQDDAPLPQGYQPDTRIDNMGYWRRMAAKGLVPVQPVTLPAPAIYVGSKPIGRGVTVEDSPDVPVTSESSTQSENSVFVDLSNQNHVLNSNNSTQWPGAGNLYGANYFHSFDAAQTWTGQVSGAGGSNQGDPVALINTTGRYFINFIDNSYGQSVSYSDNQGQTWTTAKISNGGIFNILDKNHMWVDNSQTSPYLGHLYCGWMESNEIYISRSITNGVSWEAKVVVSTATAAGSHNQGVNFKTGPDGEVYAAWSVYDSWPGDEKAIGFSKSLDGGITWQPAARVLNNIRGIRTTEVSQNQRVNSFPSMAVDLSNSPYRGNIYIVWPNIGVPGVNTGSGCDIYMIRSTDEGATWSSPIKINTDSAGTGKTHYFSWIACDMANGMLSVVFYDNRNVTATQAETWMAWSNDGGDTWEDMRVSDVSFTPSPIPGLATGYMGDYLGIDSYDGKTYPCWSDNRQGFVMTYVSPIDLISPSSAIVYDNYVLNDTTYGNGNGVMDYGEDELLGLCLMNDGNLDAESVTVYISTDSPFITLLDSVEYYGDFAVGQKKTILNAYRFTVSDSVPDNTWIPFTIKAVNALDSVTYSNFQILSHAPEIDIISLVLDDATGNNNGILDPGESAVIRIQTQNTGDYTAENVVSMLSSANPYVSIVQPVCTIGNINAGVTVYATFNVTANEAAANGSAALLHNIATSLYRQTDRYFILDIGLNVEDWETGNFQKFAWQFSGNEDWTIDPDVKWEGLYGARSGTVEQYGSSVLEIQYNVLLNDSISFYRKVSSRTLSDYLKFYIDGLQVGQWSGNQDWARYVYPVLAGPHIFKWEYIRSGATPSGEDCAWVDFIVFPPEYRMTVAAGPDAEVCAGSDYQLHGMAVSYDSLLWTTSGTGTFDDPHILDPRYTPSSQDLSAGTVTLTLTGFGINSSDTTDSMVLSILPSPVISAGNNGAICNGTSYSLSEATASGFTSLGWTTSGDGTFDNPSSTNPVYTPGQQDIAGHGAVLTLAAQSEPQCPLVKDSLELAIFDLPAVNIGKDTAICAGQSYTLDAATANATSYLWSPGGQTTPAIVVDSSGIGLGSREFSVVVTDQNGCQGTDAALVSFKICGGIPELTGVDLAIYPNPNDGNFAVEIRSLKPATLDITISSAGGAKVFEQSGLTVNGSVTKQIRLDKSGQGTYILELTDGKAKLFRKIVIQR